MTITLKDADGDDVLLKTRNVNGEEVPAHDILSLPGTTQADIAASKGYLQTLAGMIASARAAVDVGSLVTGYLKNLADAYDANAFNVNLSVAVEAALATLAGAVTPGARLKVDVDAATAGKLDALIDWGLNANAQSIYNASASILATLQGSLTVDLSTTVNGYLAALAGSVTSSRVAVDLSTTVNGYLAALASAITAGRVAVDLAATPTANLATLAAAITSGRVQVDLAATPLANLAALAAAITGGRVQTDLGATPTGNLATLAGAVAAARVAVNVDSTTTGKLDQLHTDLVAISGYTDGIEGLLTTLNGALSAGRMQVDLAAAINAYLAALAGTVGAGRIAVDLAATPLANLAALAAAITSGRLQTDLGATPTANLATLAGHITAGRAAVDLATTPTANLATLAGAIASGRMSVDLAATPLANLAALAAAITSGRLQVDILRAYANAAYLTNQTGVASFQGAWLDSRGYQSVNYTASWSAVAATAGVLGADGTDDPAQAAANVVALPVDTLTVGTAAGNGSIVIGTPPAYTRLNYAWAAGGGANQFQAFATRRA